MFVSAGYVTQREDGTLLKGETPLDCTDEKEFRPGLFKENHLVTEGQVTKGRQVLDPFDGHEKEAS